MKKIYRIRIFKFLSEIFFKIMFDGINFASMFECVRDLVSKG